MSSVPVDADVFGSYDAVVLATAHDAFKDTALYRKARLVVDTRSVVAPPLAGRAGEGLRVVRA